MTIPIFQCKSSPWSIQNLIPNEDDNDYYYDNSDDNDSDNSDDNDSDNSDDNDVMTMNLTSCPWAPFVTRHTHQLIISTTMMIIVIMIKMMMMMMMIPLQ